MELLYCTCGHREGMHSARDGGCFEHGCPCMHFVQRDYIKCPVCGDGGTLSPNGFTCTLIHNTRPEALFPLSEYHEDMGAVLWWTLPIEEAPFVGSPLDSDWNERRHWQTGESLYPTHFSRLPDYESLFSTDGAKVGLE